MKKNLILLALCCGVLACFAVPALAASNGTPQASLTLNSCNTALCNKTNTSWSLSKCETDPSGNCLPNETVYTDNIPASITWSVQATKGSTSDKILTVTGYLSVTNTGTAPATIGNIVINLQKQVTYQKKQYWASAAADIADAQWGDLYNNSAYGSASSTPPLPQCAAGNGSKRCADIVAAASAENAIVNAANANNYLTYTNSSGWGVGTFKETAASGGITFTDASNNSIWSITPQYSLPAGATVNLLYQANFDNSILGIPDNASVRVEALVTFGNAGGRGGSGSSAKNIDINGNGTIDTNGSADSANEGNVRTVPCRTTTNVPPTENANASVTLTDPEPHTGSATLDSNLQPTFTPDASGIITFGGVSYTNFSTDIGGGTGSENLSSSATRNVGVDITVSGLGAIANCALLQGQSDSISLTDPSGHVFTFPCEVGVNLQACAWPYFNPTTQVNYCTATQGGWGAPPNGGNFGNLLVNNFAAATGGSVTVGINDGTSTHFYMTFDSAAAIQAYLPAGGPAAALNADLLDPHCSSHPCGQVTSSGVFGGQVLTLQLNMDFSNTGFTPKGLANVVYNNAGCESGQTYGQILTDANTALGGGGLPSGCSFDDLNNVVTSINEAYDAAPGCPTGGNPSTALLLMPNPIQFASLDALLASRERTLVVR